MKYFLFALLFIANYSYSAGTSGYSKPASQWVGVVTHVTDGDTLWVRAAKSTEPVKVRIEGIDAPEICQPGGTVSRRALAALVMNQVVVVQTRRHDTFGRVMARVSVRSEDVGSHMVAQGYAWSYNFKRNKGPYATEEAHARTARRGVFADGLAQEPRLFRKKYGSCHA